MAPVQVSISNESSNEVSDDYLTGVEMVLLTDLEIAL